MTTDPPSGWRVLAGFVFAPVVPAFLLASFGMLSYGYGVFVFAAALMVGGYFPALVVGLPTYAIARRRMAPTLINCALAGAFVAALPWVLLGVLSSVFKSPTGGLGTPEFWMQIPLTSVLGTVGGAVFWLIVAGPRRAPP